MPRKIIILPPDADRFAPKPCKKHQSFCDVLFPEGCPWDKCGDYQPENEEQEVEA